MTDLTISLLRAIASLSATLGLIVLLGWAWKRYGQPFSGTLAPREQRLTVLETKRLNQHTTLHLVQDGDTEHLLAATASTTTLLRSSPSTNKTKNSAKAK